MCVWSACLSKHVVITVRAGAVVLAPCLTVVSGYFVGCGLIGPKRASAMPRRPWRQRVLWYAGDVLSEDGYEFGMSVPSERSHWIWDFNEHGYYLMFDVGPSHLGLLPRGDTMPAWWVGSSVHADQGHDRLRMHLIAG